MCMCLLPFGSDLFWDTVFQNYLLHEEASFLTSQKKPLYTFYNTFYILLEYEMAVFFPELATAGFSILITVKRILMIHLCYLDSMHIHELGSHFLDWRWNKCIWLMMGITCKCYINYFCCRCHCFLSLLNIHFFFELCIWIWCT